VVKYKCADMYAGWPNKINKIITTVYNSQHATLRETMHYNVKFNYHNSQKKAVY